MGMGYAAASSWVMDIDDVKAICPNEVERLLKSLDAASIELDDWHQHNQWVPDEGDRAGRMAFDSEGFWEIFTTDEQKARELFNAVLESWKELEEAFIKATEVDGTSLQLYSMYQDPDNGSSYDDVQGGFFCIDGVEDKTPAGRKFESKMRYARWVNFE